MPRKKTPTLTPLELEIMKVLWERGASTVQEAQSAMGRPLAYTTVQTVLNLLQDKGKVERQLEGKAYRYSPTVTQSRETGRAVRDILDRFFSGSAESLVQNLIDNRQITPARLAAIRRRLEESVDE